MSEAVAPEWAYMDTLRPPVYVCLRRQSADDGSYPPFELDGRVDKEEWVHVPWSDTFVDIQGEAKKPTTYPRTRFKMMHDDTHVFIAAELEERQIWGTLRQKNSTMYHENDFEVFLDPDGSRHNYYELEMNCLNTIWELVLNKPYKDGYSIQNPYNLANTRTAVYVDGLTNSPQTECKLWSVEIMLARSDLVPFDRHHERPVMAGDLWRANFSRVQYQLETVVDDVTMELCYRKVADRAEDNIVWAPTGVIDMHRPEKWGLVFFSGASNEHDGVLQLDAAMESYLCEQLAMEQILDTIYYAQRTYFARHEQQYAESMRELFGDETNWPHAELMARFALQPPVIHVRGRQEAHHLHKGTRPRLDSAATGERKRSYVAKLDPLDERNPEDQEVLALTSARLPCASYTASVASETQEWNIEHDARLWKSTPR